VLFANGATPRTDVGTEQEVLSDAAASVMIGGAMHSLSGMAGATLVA
jgi:hypothetical protein